MSMGMGRAESSGVRTRQMGLLVVLMQTGRAHCCVVPALAGAERKKRLCMMGTRLGCCSERVRSGTPGLGTKLCMILSTGWWLLAVWAFQKSSAVALA